MRRAREKMIAEILAACPHYVDIIPPPNGYGLQIENEIFEFLDSRIGAIDMYGGVEEGVAFVRYCFLKEDDAALFREKFANVGTLVKFPRKAAG
jgi:hypothetical protein